MYIQAPRQVYDNPGNKATLVECRIGVFKEN